MPLKFNIPNPTQGLLIVSPSAGYYNITSVAGKRDFDAFFGEYFEAACEGAAVGTADKPTIIELESVSAALLYALDRTTVVVDKTENSERVLNIKTQNDPDAAYKACLKIDEEWINKCAAPLGDLMIAAITARFADDIQIEILDWKNNNLFQKNHPRRNSFPKKDHKPLVIFRFRYDRWDKTWENKKELVAYEMGQTFKISEEGRQEAEATPKFDPTKYLDAKNIAKIQDLNESKNNKGHYRLDAKTLLLQKILMQDFIFLCEALRLPKEHFFDGFQGNAFKGPSNQKPKQAKNPNPENAFKSLSSATAHYNLRQPGLTKNLLELPDSAVAQNKTNIENGLTLKFAENRQFMGAEGTTLPTDRPLVYAVPLEKEEIQKHLVNLRSEVQDVTPNFCVSLRKGNEAATLEERRGSGSNASSSSLMMSNSNQSLTNSAGGPPTPDSSPSGSMLPNNNGFPGSSVPPLLLANSEFSTSSIPKPEEDSLSDSSGSDDSDEKDNQLITDFYSALLCLSKMTASGTTTLPILKLFFEAVSWHKTLLDSMAACPTMAACSTKELNKREKSIKNFCNTSLLILSQIEKTVPQNTSYSQLITNAKSTFEQEAVKKLKTAGNIINHVDAIEGLLDAEEATSLRKCNDNEVFITLPPKNNRASTTTTSQNFQEVQNKFEALSSGFNDNEFILAAYKTLVRSTKKLVMTEEPTPTAQVKKFT